MEMIDLQDKFAVRIAESIKSPWDEVRIHYENADIEGVGREVFTAFLLVDDIKQDIDPPLDALDLLVELKGHRPEQQSEAWLWLEFTMDKTGRYKFEYKYDSPPLIMDQIGRSK